MEDVQPRPQGAFPSGRSNSKARENVKYVKYVRQERSSVETKDRP